MDGGGHDHRALYLTIADQPLEIAWISRACGMSSQNGQVLIWAGRYPDTLEPTREALALAGEIGDHLHEPDLHSNLAESLAALGRLDEALDRYRSALTLARNIGQRHTQARARDGIARVLHATGHRDQAREHCRAPGAQRWTGRSPVDDEIFRPAGNPEADQRTASSRRWPTSPATPPPWWYRPARPGSAPPPRPSTRTTRSP